MNPDELKQAWQAAGRKLTIDADVLLKQVRRSEADFNNDLFWRDMREVGGCLIMIPLWFFLGAKFDLPWTWWLGVPGLLFVAVFMLVDRMRQKPRRPHMESALGDCVERSLGQVEHQIWLLRKVAWWYLMPLAVPALAFFTQVAWMARDSGWWRALLIWAGFVGFEVAVLGFTYWLNISAVKEDLEPRRQELKDVLESLRGATH